MEEILHVVECLRRQPDTTVRIPVSWSLFGFEPAERLPGGELRVPAGDFFAHAIERGVLRPDSIPLKNAVGIVYSMMVRMFTAYDYTEKDAVQPGTFVRALALLPLLERMGVDTVYLLPVFTHSRMHNKGAWGSPYAIKDFFALDPEQHDPLMGDYSKESLERQFKAFVQGCHARGMRVMLDFVFRTCARDNVLIQTHPDWFYWVDTDEIGAFHAPFIEGHPNGGKLDKQAVGRIYASPETKAYIRRFRHGPQTQDPALFADICKEGGNVLQEIEQRMHLTTAPAFSDVVNDPQPPWTDVTYLRFDFAPTKASEACTGEDTPPFVLHDAIKLNVFPARKPNRALIDMIQSVIPHYIDRFGIDGARVDMGHALEPAQNRSIVAGARELKPDFIFWSEQLGMQGAQTARDEGFDFISGDVWSRYAHAGERMFGTRVVRGLHACALPYAAAMELPDTPRSALLIRPRARWETFTLFNALLPNSVLLINSGQEMAETQPMNLGLGSTREGRHTLPKSDPMQGRLAFFDPYRLHWNQLQDGLPVLEKAHALRQEAIELITDAKSAVAPRYPGTPWVAAVLYQGRNGCFVAVMNTGTKRAVRVRLSDVFRPGALRRNAWVCPAKALGQGYAKQRTAKKILLRPGEIFAGWVAYT
ncbi:MAG: alpha-amylase family glycosyl hydrolase [Bacillota bacterium]